MAYHLQYPFLPYRKIGHRRGEVNDFHADSVLLEVLKLCLDVTLIAAQTVKRFHTERVTGTKHRRFQCLIPRSVGASGKLATPSSSSVTPFTSIKQGFPSPTNARSNRELP